MAFEQEQHLKIKINTYVGGKRESGGREPNQETTNNTREQKTRAFPWLLTVQIQEMLGLYTDKMHGSISFGRQKHWRNFFLPVFQGVLYFFIFSCAWIFIIKKSPT